MFSIEIETHGFGEDDDDIYDITLSFKTKNGSVEHKISCCDKTIIENNLYSHGNFLIRNCSNRLDICCADNTVEISFDNDECVMISTKYKISDVEAEYICDCLKILENFKHRKYMSIRIEVQPRPSHGDK